MAVKGPVWGTRNSYLSPGVIGVLHMQCIPLNLVRLSCIILTFLRLLRLPLGASHRRMRKLLKIGMSLSPSCMYLHGVLDPA